MQGTELILNILVWGAVVAVVIRVRKSLERE
jgi:hypothetical protein